MEDPPCSASEQARPSTAACRISASISLCIWLGPYATPSHVPYFVVLRVPTRLGTSLSLTPLSVAAFVSSPPSSVFRVLHGPSWHTTESLEPVWRIPLGLLFATADYAQPFVGSSFVRLGDSELVIPNSRPRLSFADRPLVPLRLGLRRGPVLARRSMPGLPPIQSGIVTDRSSVMSTSDLVFLGAALCLFFLLCWGSVLSLYVRRFPSIFASIVSGLPTTVVSGIGSEGYCSLMCLYGLSGPHCIYPG